MRRNSRTALVPYWIILLSIAATFLSIELFFRAIEHIQTRLGIRQSSTFIKTSDGTVYGMQPGVVTRNRKAVTNSLGIRAAEPHEAIQARERILVVGDSVTFGGEVESYSTFTAQLQHHLDLKMGEGSAPASGQPVVSVVSVVNGGVPGYSTYNELMQYRRLKDIYQPQHVVVQFCVNDIVNPWLHWNQFIAGGITDSEIPPGAIPNPNYHTLLTQLHWSRTALELRRRWNQTLEALGFLGASPQPYLTGEDILRLSRFDDERGDEVIWLQTRYKELLTEIRNDGRKATLLVVPLKSQVELNSSMVSRSPQRVMSEIAKDNGVRLLDVTEPLLKERIDSQIEVFSDPWHLSVGGHRVVARELASVVVSGD